MSLVTDQRVETDPTTDLRQPSASAENLDTASTSNTPISNGRHFSDEPGAGGVAKKQARRLQFNQAIERLRHDNPLLSVPVKHRARLWLFAPVAALMNYIVPTRYMRFFWGKVWFIACAWLPSDSLRPRAPYVPQRSYRTRMARSATVAQNVLFNTGKVITSFHLGGGVGKTTHSGRLGLQIKQLRPDLNVDIIDCEEGTLIQRFVRNTRNSFLDFLNNLKKGLITQPSDLARYRSITPGGAHVVAWRREDQTNGVRDVKRQEMVDGVTRFALYSGIVVCDLPGGAGPKNRGVLDATHQVQLVTIPAEDRLDQAVAAFTWLMENGYEHLARTAVIVVNKCRSYADVDKVRERFYAKYPADMDEVRFQPFSQSRYLLKGGKINLKKFPRSSRSQYAEYTAALLEELADGHRTDGDSMMTHHESSQVDRSSEKLPLRLPRVGHPTPSNEDDPADKPQE